MEIVGAIMTRTGFLDLYVCNYDSNGTTNYLFKNHGDGTFSDVTEIAGVGNGFSVQFPRTLA